MEKPNKDKQAFASAALSGYKYLQEFGLTKREYFAAAAMQGILANAELRRRLEEKNTLEVDYLAQLSLKYADALLIELEN